jgi:hypothetical protein
VDRQLRRQILICRITAAGNAYCPLPISANPHVTQVFNTGVRDGIEFKIEISPSPSATQAIFGKHVDEVRIPAVTANRHLDGCTNKPAIMFCHKCSAHCSEDILKEPARYGILAITYPPHTSGLFQVADGFMFGILKRAKRHQRRDEMLLKQVDHVLQFFRACEQATASATIRAWWNKTGFDSERRDEKISLVLSEWTIAGRTGFEISGCSTATPEAVIEVRVDQRTSVSEERTSFLEIINLGGKLKQNFPCGAELRVHWHVSIVLWHFNCLPRACREKVAEKRRTILRSISGRNELLLFS